MSKKALLLGMFVMIGASVIFAQNIKKEYTQTLVGTWKVDSLEMGSFNLSPEYEKIIKEKLPEIIAMTEVKFTANKKYFRQGFEGKQTGTWDISSDGQFVLVKIDGQSKVNRTKIISLTNEKLIMAPDDENAVNSKVYMYKAN